MSPDPAALTLLALEVGPLVRDLRQWEPVGIEAERLLAAAAGAEAYTQHDVDRVRAWCRRWQKLPQALRDFYAPRAPRVSAVGAGLYLVLDGRVHQASRALQGALHQEFRTAYGHPPPWSLLPRVP